MIRNLKSQISNVISRISNLECLILKISYLAPQILSLNLKSKILRLKSEIWNLKSKIWNLKSYVSNPRSQAYNFKFHVIGCGEHMKKILSALNLLLWYHSIVGFVIDIKHIGHIFWSKSLNLNNLLFFIFLFRTNNVPGNHRSVLLNEVDRQ